MSSPILVRPGNQLVVPCVQLGRFGLLAFLTSKRSGTRNYKSVTLNFECDQSESGVLEVRSFIRHEDPSQTQIVDLLTWGRLGYLIWVRIRHRGSRSSLLLVFKQFSRSSYSIFVNWIKTLESTGAQPSLLLDILRVSWGQR